MDPIVLKVDTTLSELVRCTEPVFTNHCEDDDSLMELILENIWEAGAEINADDILEDTFHSEGVSKSFPQKAGRSSTVRTTV
jgi:hypothetical protein